MLAIRIRVNDSRTWTAGVGDDGSAHAVLGITRGRFVLPNSEGDQDSGARFTVAGLKMRGEVAEQLRWLDFALSPGDVVRMEVIESEVVDPAEVMAAPTSERREELARSQIAQLRKQLAELEARYPSG